MNLVFMSTLEKKIGERVIAARVSICEKQGKWHVLWNEPREDGKMEQQSWFEGDSWEEMISVFRMELSAKSAQGFLPVIEGVIPSGH